MHAETCCHLDRVIAQIRATGAKPGVVLNPHTPPECLEYLLDQLHHVRVDSETAIHQIRHLEVEIGSKSQERVRLGQEIQRLQARYDQATTEIGRDCGDLRLELERNRALLGMKVIARAVRPALDVRRKYVF